MRDIAGVGCDALIRNLFQNQLAGRSREHLITEMCSNVELHYDRNDSLLAAFTAGYDDAS